jgi:hypothetical protein
LEELVEVDQVELVAQTLLVAYMVAVVEQDQLQLEALMAQ